MDQKNDFHLRGIRYLLFDIFYKNNTLWLIGPVYDLVSFSSELMNVSIGGKRLELTTKHISTYYYGPASVYVYNVEKSSQSVQVTVEYEGRKKEFHLQHIKTTEKPELALTTLCKGDYQLFIPFYKFYKDQGVSHFYIYYNGTSTLEINKFFQGFADVTLIEWDYIYWLDDECTQHHAQVGQINHALYKYGKGTHTHMAFCDFDEYLHVPKTTLKQLVDSHSNIDTFGFCNKWSQTIDNKVPDVFPTTFLTETGQLKYPTRSKNIYKVSDVKLLCVHHPIEYCRSQSATSRFIIDKQRAMCDLHMYHFYNWTRPDRKVDEHLVMHTLSDENV
jgi:hypothetical protein